jgi:membrane fusion protein, multidrug efflux system
MPSPGSRRFRITFWPVLLLLALVLAGAWYFHAKGASGQQGPGRGPQARPAPVSAVAAKVADMPVYLTGLGTVTPVQSAVIKSRVDGELMRVFFGEGQMVKKGDLLAEIDPRPFQVQLAQAEGQMARDRALLENAKMDLARYQSLVSGDFIARQQADTQLSLVRQYEGAVKTDQGQIDNAKLLLTYSRITAPFDGRVGLRLVDPGNMVKAADQGGLLVINQVTPITVVFTLAEDHLPKVAAKMAAGASLPVDAFDREQKLLIATGTLLTVDNQIDQTTGTVKLKASFDNRNLALFPNQFVNARLKLDTVRGAVVVPAAAVSRGPQGSFVYVVKDDKTVSVRPVVLGETAEGASVVTQGLAAGEAVVVEGAERLREGAPVEVKGEGEAARKAGS